MDSIQEDLDAFAALDIPDMPMLKCCRYLYAASAASQKGDDSTAIECLQKAYHSVDDILTPGRFKHNISDMIALTYARANRWDEAINASEISIDDAKRDSLPDLLGISYSYISDFYSNIGLADSAMAYKLKSIEIKDSLFSSKKYGIIKDLKNSYDMKVVNEELSNLIRKRETQQLVLAIVSVSAIIVLVLLVIVHGKSRKLRKSNKELFLKMQDSIASENKERERRKIYERKIAELENAGKDVPMPSSPHKDAAVKYESSSPDFVNVSPKNHLQIKGQCVDAVS